MIRAAKTRQNPALSAAEFLRNGPKAMDRVKGAIIGPTTAVARRAASVSSIDHSHPQVSTLLIDIRLIVHGRSYR